MAPFEGKTFALHKEVIEISQIEQKSWMSSSCLFSEVAKYL
jgi:hypothetical protein